MQDKTTGNSQQTGLGPGTNIAMNNTGTDNRPEVENPQPTRKVEEPIIGHAMEANEKSTTTGSNEDADGRTNENRSNSDKTSESSDDYKRSEAGFQSGKR
jgi:hypothetical protein